MDKKSQIQALARAQPGLADEEEVPNVEFNPVVPFGLS
jgi:hypothetical protein